MLEREIKFHVPESRRDALTNAMLHRQAQEQQLQARYFDTPARALAQARVALRLRNESGQWVQTIKAPGADPLTRFEHNQKRQDATLDLAIYRDSPVAGLLESLRPELAPTYAINVQRLVLRQEHQGAVIEVAYDRGELHAGDLCLVIHELELELVSGPVDALFTLAEDWLQEYGLILELRSKAERGDALAALAAPCTEDTTTDLSALIRVQRAGSVRLRPEDSLAQAYAACAGDCLIQIIRNAASLAGIDSEHATPSQRIALVHQLRVGVRRLRSCWHLFKPWVARDASQQAAELRRYFTLFGENRDNAVIQHDITPQMRDAGMPAVTFPPTSADDPSLPVNLAASAGFQTTLLKLLAQLLADTDAGATPSDSADTEPLQRTMAKRLNKWLRQITQEGQAFAQLPPPERHELRKKVKRLRYGLDFSLALFGDSMAPIHASLTSVQGALGTLNDLYTAEAFYQQLDQTQPGVWFAQGWLRAMQRQASEDATTSLLRLAEQGVLDSGG